MSKRIYRVESIEEYSSTMPSLTKPEEYEVGTAYGVRFRLDNPSENDGVIDASLQIAYRKKEMQIFKIGQKISIEVLA